jgi:hypothetical protein
MQCPNCKLDPLPEGASFCLRCGQPVGIAARMRPAEAQPETAVNAEVTVATNYGNVIGIKAGSIHGTVYGGDIYNVQLYVLSSDGQSGDKDSFTDRNAPPYQFLSAYTARDRLRFRGRQTEIRQVLDRIGASPLLVLYGKPGAGKTSLIAAGVIPQLIEDGAMAVHIREYSHPIALTLKGALQQSQEQIPLQLTEDDSLAVMISKLQQSTGGTLVLVLDQFENLLNGSLPEAQAAAQIMSVAEAYRTIDDLYLRLILVTRDSEFVSLTELKDTFPDVFRSFLELESLSWDQALAAVVEPNDYVERPIYYEEGFVEEYLLPELIRLSDAGVQRSIYPPHLQIVCHQLYNMAVAANLRVVGKRFYLETAKGAQGLFYSYLDETLQTQLADQRELAWRVLVRIAAGTREWVTPETLNLEDVSLEQVSRVMDRLRSAGLLVGRPEEDDILYGYTSKVLEEPVRRRAGAEIERTSQAARELDRAWAAWAAHRDIITARQLARLQEFGAALTPLPLQSLLLLRSAAAQRAAVSSWLPGLRAPEARALVRRLGSLPEPPSAGQERRPPEIHFTPDELVYAAELTGLPVDMQAPDFRLLQQPEHPENNPTAYGPLAISAVSSAQADVRQVAALALLAENPHQAVDQIDWALDARLTGVSRLLRKAELRGVMAEADPSAEAVDSRLSFMERAGVWGWRVIRRLSNDGLRLWSLAAPAGLGAGLLLAFWRLLVARLVGLTPTLHAYQNFGFGWMLASALVLGLLLPDYLLLPRPGSGRLISQAGRKAAVLGIILATLAFWQVTSFIMLVTGRLPDPVFLMLVAAFGLAAFRLAGFSRRWTVITPILLVVFIFLWFDVCLPFAGLEGFGPCRIFAGKELVGLASLLIGLALAAALSISTYPHLRLERSRWILSIILAGFLFASVQAVSVLLSNVDTTAVIFYPAIRFYSDLNALAVTPPWQGWMASLPCEIAAGPKPLGLGCWANILAIIDAGMVGLTLSLGTLMGMRIGQRLEKVMRRRYLQMEEVEEPSQ